MLGRKSFLQLPGSAFLFVRLALAPMRAGICRIGAVRDGPGTLRNLRWRRGGRTMVQRVIVFIFVVVFGIATAFGKTYTYTYPMACGNLWPAVKDTLANQDEYAKVAVDEAKTTAEYQPKHSVHVDITGTVLQRMNHVTLVPKGTGCEMEVV